MARVSLLGVIVLFAAAASADPVAGQPAFDEAELVSGAVLALEPAAPPLVLPSPDDAFQLDSAMRTFIAPFAAIRDPRHKLLEIIDGLEEHGMFSHDYAEVTRTASATFHDRQGNCLSFTMLFVGLARAAGLTATYQSVEVPPTWANDGQVVIASHVNAVVRTGRSEETVVDFNIRGAQKDLHSQRVSDAYALGLFYTNLGAEALLRAEYAASLAYLREAAHVYPDIAGLWVNLGVLYARHGRYEHAEAAYLRALAIDKSEQSALGNLVLVYEALGKPQLVEEYRDRVRAYRDRNPYYHFALATRAYEQQQFANALTALRKAVRLKSDEHEFYALRGDTLTALGRSREAQNNFERAREFEAIEYERTQSRVRFEGFEDP
jgi:Flp pilus assembly protein TadD